MTVVHLESQQRFALDREILIGRRDTVDPDEDTVTAARETLGMHPIAAADVVAGRQQPKVQNFAEHLFILLWSVLHKENSDELVLAQTYVYIGDGWLLTVQRGQGGELTDRPS